MNGVNWNRGTDDRTDKLALRPREAAKMLSISERTLYSLTKRGAIRAVRLSESRQSGVLYPVAELERFLASRLSCDATAAQDAEGRTHG